MREYFHQQLAEIKSETLRMGSMVEEELKTALAALESLDTGLARQVYQADKAVNQLRFALEERCTVLISTQQPTAQDLRAILAVMNMIVDLERMGDQAKGIAKVIPGILKYPDDLFVPPLTEMGAMVLEMLRQAMTAYAQDNIAVAKAVLPLDDPVDKRFARFFSEIMFAMSGADGHEKVEAYYDLLRVAREIERFGDLAINIAERVIYIATGYVVEGHTDPDEILDYHLDN
ncbi:MAG TPA: phosphate signaling complex protein PhoU [Anaerolineae bacterium]|nr:phosphate signaling complex protein PhoU [Anaerolineae bacterium]HMR66274.1 phosphate signaling complex protein PhoU [Anaerolineae bacterium]